MAYMQVSKHPLYHVWVNMRQRCYNPNIPNYKNYGGRGIKVCKRWSNFELFVSDMGERPKGYSIDRRDNNKDYEPSNCRWATMKQQRENQRPMGTGVSFDSINNSYRAYISRHGVRHHLGRYKTEKEAVAAREKAIKLYYQH